MSLARLPFADFWCLFGACLVLVYTRRRTSQLSKADAWRLTNFDRPMRSEERPTMKPIALYPIINSSQTGEIVLDLFGGSGSTMIACEKHSRRARVMELDPKYVDVSVRRWQTFSGGTATLGITVQR
jgi:DNA modification methylase